jgi:cytosine/adenosine deaminase-related metal-dependent hydrolase
LVEHGVVGNNCLIAHLNYLNDYDFDLVADSGASVVHCPKCHTYFGHAPFPMERLRSAGVNICLGTDSLASNNSLDMRSEMRHAQKYHRLSARELLEMCTLNGAKALGQKGKLGQLSPGANADLAVFTPSPAVSLEQMIERPYDCVLSPSTQLSLLVVQGKQVNLEPSEPLASIR